MDLSKNLQEMFRESRSKIVYYRQMSFMTPYFCQKINYEKLICRELLMLDDLLREVDLYIRASGKVDEAQLRRQKEFTLQELAAFNGAEGKPAYVAVNGIVYDVSTQSAWGGGTHFSLYAGQDLTNQFASCHGTNAILSKLPQVGVLKG